jgi:hypothetical protein
MGADSPTALKTKNEIDGVQWAKGSPDPVPRVPIADPKERDFDLSPLCPPNGDANADNLGPPK